MNIIGHHEAARQYSGRENPAYLFGSMVSDFVGMFRLPKRYRSVELPEGPLRDGMDLHQPTNTVFDGLEVIRSLNRAMAESFKRFMPIWPANQAAAVGRDILFDGYFMDKPDVIDSYSRTMDAAISGEIDFGNITEPIETFKERLVRFVQMGPPNYNDPYEVAYRLQRRLVGTKSSFDESLVEDVSESMAEYLPHVQEIGAEVVQLVVSGLSSRPDLASKLTDKG
jgi:hypothetical protein